MLKISRKLSHKWRKSRIMTKITGFLLAFAIMVTSLPMDGIYALAANDTVTQSESQTTTQPSSAEEVELVSVVRELTEYRNEFSKTFLMSDGTLESVVSSNPIHYSKDGKWQEIDSTLTLSTDEKGNQVYKNTSGAYSVELPASAQSGEEITITKGEKELSIKLIEAKNSKAKKDNSKKEKKQKLTKEQRKRMTAGQLFEVDNTQTDAIEYSEVYSDADLRYDVTPNEVKESVILNKAPNKKASYSYEITADGLVATINSDGSVDFYDKADKEKTESVFHMPAPLMYDSNDEYSYDIVTTLKEKKGVYTLTYKPSYEWLKAKERAYPVVLDPSVVINSSIQDAYTYSADSYLDTYLGYEQQLKVGKSNWKSDLDYFETYIKFNQLPDIPLDEFSINSAYLMLMTKSYGGTWEELTLGAYEVTENWYNHQSGTTSTRITYNNAPQNFSAPCATAVFARSALNTFTEGFEVASLVEKWYNDPGTNYGIKLGIVSETDNNGDHIVFHSSRTQTGTAPYLSITYTDPIDAIYLLDGDMTCTVGETFTLNTGRVGATVSERQVVYESSDTSVLTLNGKEVTILSTGTADISVYFADDPTNILDSITVTAYPGNVVVNLPQGNTLNIGDTWKFVDTTYMEAVSDSSSNVVSLSEDGWITANEIGTEFIDVNNRYNPTHMERYEIRVVPQGMTIVGIPSSLNVGDYIQGIGLQFATDVEYDPMDVSWSAHNTDDTEISTVVEIVNDYVKGVQLTALSGGTAKIYATIESLGVTASTTVTVNKIPVTSVELSSVEELEDHTIYLGEKGRLKAVVKPNNSTHTTTFQRPTWTASNNSDNKVQLKSDNNIDFINVCAKSVGTVQITATADGVASDAYQITVKAATVSFKSVPKNGMMYVDDIFSLQTITNPIGLNVEYSLGGNKNAASISGNTITAKRPGEIIVTAKIKYYGYEHTTSISVLVSAPSVWIDGDLSTPYAVGETLQLKTEKFTSANMNDKVVWESKNENIATVDPNSGLVTFLSPGYAHITVTYEEYPEASDFVLLEVVQITITKKPTSNTLYVGENHELGYTTTSSNNSLNFKWRSSNDNIASIDQYTGKITAKKSGNIKIYVFCVQNTKIIDEISINVSRKYKDRTETLLVGMSADGYSEGSCKYGEVPSIQCATSFFNGIGKDLSIDLGFYNFNRGDMSSMIPATKNDFLSKSLYNIQTTNIDDVDLMLYVGHGLTSSGLHFSRGSNGYLHSHYPDVHDVAELNFSIAEARFGYGNSRTKWVATYTCNFLNHSLDELKTMMRGVNIVLGYSTASYLIDEQMELFGQNLYYNQTIINAWFNSSIKHTQFSPIDATMSAIYVDDAKNDTIYHYLVDTKTFLEEDIYQVSIDVAGKS